MPHRFRYPSSDATWSQMRPGSGPSIATSLPTTRRTPASSAASIARTIPYRPSQSATPSASYPSSAARATRAFGDEPPRSSEKFVLAASSTKDTGARLLRLTRLRVSRAGDSRAHELHQRVDVEGLAEPWVRHALEELPRPHGEGSSRHEHHLLGLRGRDLADLLEEHRRVHLGHHQIAEDHVEPLAGDDERERLAGARQGDDLGLGREEALEREADDRLVVDHEDAPSPHGLRQRLRLDAGAGHRGRAHRPDGGGQLDAEGRALAHLALER